MEKSILERWKVFCFVLEDALFEINIYEKTENGFLFKKTLFKGYFWQFIAQKTPTFRLYLEKKLT